MKALIFSLPILLLPMLAKAEIECRLELKGLAPEVMKLSGWDIKERDLGNGRYFRIEFAEKAEDQKLIRFSISKSMPATSARSVEFFSETNVNGTVSYANFWTADVKAHCEVTKN